VIDRAFFGVDVVSLARRLVGITLLVDGVGGVIVETEAYHRYDDAAAHSARGVTPRTRVMFGPPGHLYVYRSYGLHWCMNVVGGTLPGCAVLLRAVQPTHAVGQMHERRGKVTPRLLCAGPGRLTQALGVNISHNGADLSLPPFTWIIPHRATAVIAGPRIGITKDVHHPWRFTLAGSSFVSRRVG